MSKNICLWSMPRNVSTALMYSFSQRLDTKVFDEVLYAHYLSFSAIDHPGKEKIIESLGTNSKAIINEITSCNEVPINFYKLMTHFLIGININFLEKVHNIIFIRNPIEVIASYSKVISSPNIQDIGIKKQYELYNYLNRKKIPVLILDSKYLLENPELILNKLCDKLDIPFDRNMLNWPKGPKKEDGCWAIYWYSNVHDSTKFNMYKKTNINLKGNYKNLADHAKVYYDFLSSKSIKI